MGKNQNYFEGVSCPISKITAVAYPTTHKAHGLPVMVLARFIVPGIRGELPPEVPVSDPIRE